VSVGTLYVVATPIGNLEDFSARGARVLAQADLIAAEDTRHSAKLLQHYGIHTKVVSIHDHNERAKTPQLLEILRAGKSIALVSDAGTPLLSDPGFHLVRAARGANIAVVPIPGPCAAITALVPLWPIHRANRIKRVIIATYQAASGAGAAAMEELVESTRASLEGRIFQPSVMPHPYAFNLFNHNTAIDPATGYNDEETKVIQETRKIFEDQRIAVGVTCVRVPVLRAHCEAITFECENPITEHEVREILSGAPGVKIVDDRVKNYFPMPIDASGQDDVLGGRIRKDLSDPTGHSISMFAAADQLLKGAALNAIQIAELLPQRVMA